MTEAAPLHADLAGMHDGGEAVWLSPAGARIRTAVWPEGARGTVIIFNGRSEYIEKYGPTIAALQERGFAVATLDWRGQGLSDRPLREPMKGHVGGFEEYQQDVEALLAWEAVAALPKPHVLIGHSMGGCIATRALVDGRLDPAAIIMSGPMLGIEMSPPLRVASRVLMGAAKIFGFEEAFTPDPKPTIPYVDKTSFADNTLTTDAAQFKLMQDHLKAAPDLALGPPTYGWLARAIKEMKALRAAPHPSQPTLYLLGSDETITSPAAIRAAAARASNAELALIDGGKHENFMESPEKQDEIWRRIDAFLDGKA